MSAAAKCLQAMLAIFNLAYLALGIVIVLAGGGLLVVTNSSSTGASRDLFNIGIGLTVVGAVIILVSLFGTIGACCRARCSLMFYFVLLVLMAAAQIAIGSYSLALAQNDAKINEFAQSSWQSMNSTQQADFGEKYDCCGFDMCLLQKPCGPVLEDQIQTSLNKGGIIFFACVGVEFFAGAIALILFFDESKRTSGFGRSY
jgi:hypothetical protein